MNYIRTLVSGKKKRFIDRKFNLDLSYITPRIIAMAYPASGLEVVYRNDIESVSKFLKDRHKGNFLVINLSGKRYDNTKFENRVKEYQWVDHHAPPLKLLFEICYEMHQYLKENVENVVAINCRAGKGRTGTVICCYLLFCGMFNNPEDVFQYYAKKRFNIGEGVTQPSQKRYVYYFHQLLKERIYFPLVRTLKSIYINKIPNKNSEGSIRPFFEIYFGNKDQISYTNKNNFRDQKKIFCSNTDLIAITDSDFNFTVAGDITIKIYNNTMLSTKKIGRISFNTAFLNANQNILVFKLREIDPDNLVRNKNIAKDFEIHLKFNNLCDCQNKELPIKLCNFCTNLLKEELTDWKEIDEILNYYYSSDKSKAKVYLFGEFDTDDIEQVLGEEEDEADIRIYL